MAWMPPTNPDTPIADLLTDYVDGVAPLEILLHQYDISYHQISDLVELTGQLDNALVEVTPSTSFVDSLYTDLVNAQHHSRAWWQVVPVPRRVQLMSNRTKIAAGIGGLTLVYLTARSLSHFLAMRQREETSNKLAA
ncbi:hypothetical protein ACFLYO_01100 [Chloroflexota bacterium]